MRAGSLLQNRALHAARLALRCFIPPPATSRSACAIKGSSVSGA
jgi:hypothetical protein